MSQELSNEISPEIINSLILTGDMSKLTAQQQTQYYGAVCKDLGLNPLTQPFAIIILQNKRTLYATKGCTQQLCNIRKINTEVKSRELKDSVYIVTTRATMPDGRFTDEDGIVGITGLKGTELANAMMKASTKSKRRAVLALCGLGMSDESEVEDIPQARTQTIKPLMINVPENAEIIEKESHDAQKETEKVAEIEKVQEVKQTEKDKPKATVMDTESITTKTNSKLPKGVKQVVGIITEIPKTATLEKGQKWSFLIEDKRYGTFDKEIADSVMECIDQRIMVKFEYTERKETNKEGKPVIFNDISKFSRSGR